MTIDRDRILATEFGVVRTERLEGPWASCGQEVHQVVHLSNPMPFWLTHLFVEVFEEGLSGEEIERVYRTPIRKLHLGAVPMALSERATLGHFIESAANFATVQGRRFVGPGGTIILTPRAPEGLEHVQIRLVAEALVIRPELEQAAVEWLYLHALSRLADIETAASTEGD